MRYFFVDTENVGDYSFIKEMEVTSSDSIVLFVSEMSRRVKLEDLKLINMSGAKLVYEDVYTGEANALDFQLIAFIALNLANSEESCEYYIVSNDNDYILPAKYLSEKTNKNISILKTNEVVLPEIDRNVVVESLSDIVEELFGESDVKSEILSLIEESKALNILHNNLRERFGHENGREIYIKVKPHIKSLYKTV